MRALPLLVVLAIALTFAAPAAGQQSARDSARTAKPKPKDAEAYELRAVEVLPRLRNGAEFLQVLAREYPPALRDAGRGAIVEVRFTIEPDGTTSNHRVMETTDPEFVEPTLRAVTSLRYSPARVDGRPVRAWAVQPIHWTVAHEPEPASTDPAAPSSTKPGTQR